MILVKMIDLAEIEGNEMILDLGTGSGIIAIGFAKYLKNGKAYGVDRYSIEYNTFISKIISFIKINFIGNSKSIAESNAIIENVKKNCEFITADLIKNLDFTDNFFDLVLSSQFLYSLSNKNLFFLLEEINRTLKKGGKVIFFESKSYNIPYRWNISIIENFFDELGYQIKIIKNKDLKNHCIFIGKKM
jgi:ubiquinone/menaquinone biosynthesis C-methylase UbiE